MAVDVDSGVKPISVGQEIEGFEITRVVELPHMRATACQGVHKNTGARVLHIHNADTENLFSITFPTLPRDDTGAPHILEHAVLAGSRKYRVKDPFFQLTRMSMATFINAMTGPDLTYYPVSSNVRQDLFNLAEVYCDAVFHPNLTRGTFDREGHHFEFATPEDPSSDLLIKGIVYNEMKGVYSDPENLLFEAAQRRLLPDSVYGRDSGGDPERIPDLTWQQLRDFHGTFYHPSNALIFLYGDIPTADYFAFLRTRLDEFNKKQVDTAIARQKRWTAPREYAGKYPADQQTPMENATYISMHYLVGDLTNIRETLEMATLSLILFGHQGAPLRKAIIDSKLGQDLVHSGFDPGTLETRFHVGIKGSEADRKDAFVQLVRKTLSDIAEKGVDPELVEAALQQMAYSYQEIQSGYPLWLLNKSVDFWCYGVDPLTLLQAEKLIADLRQRYQADRGMFGQLIREKILDNPHCLTVVFSPDRELAARKQAAFLEAMQQKKAGLSPEEVQEIVRNTAELKAYEDQTDSPEAVAALPQLRVKDLPATPRHIPTETLTLPAGVPVLWNDVFANGVNYLHLDFDLAGLDEDLLIYLPLFGDCIRKMGAGGRNYADTAQRVARYTGGVSAHAYAAGHATDPKRTRLGIRFVTKALDATLTEALATMHDFIFSMDPTDTVRLQDVLTQSRAAYRTNIASHGYGLSVNASGGHISHRARLAQKLGGLPQTRFIDQLAVTFESRRDEVVQSIARIGKFLLSRARLTVSFTGSPKLRESVLFTLNQWAGEMGGQPLPVTAQTSGGALKPQRLGLAAPMDVAYCALTMPAPHASDPSAPLLTLAANYLSRGYLLEEIRFKGTAYGGGGSYSSLDGAWKMHSYRDPWVNRTLDVYANMLNYVRGEQWSQMDIDHTIIATAKDSERPIRPEAATGDALWYYLTGETRAFREQRHAALLAATPKAVQAKAIEVLENNASASGVCVVSNREKLEEANRQRPETPLEIQDVFETPAAGA